MYVPYNTEQICCAYKAKYNNEPRNQVILLMITDGDHSDGVKKWHYLTLKSEPALYNGKLCNCPVKSLSRLLKGKSSNHKGDCLNCFYSYSTENRFKEHEEICNKNDSCCIIMLRWDDKIFKYNHAEKSLKVPFVIYLDLECLLLKMPSCQNNPKNSYTERKTKHEPSGWAIITNCSFDATKNKLDYYRWIDCIKVLCKKLKDHALKIINHEKKEMIPLSEEENKYCEQ